MKSHIAMSRKEEEAHLEEVLSIVKENISSYSGQVEKMQADIDEMLEHYHDNDAEVYTILNNTITLHDHMKRALERNLKAMDKPYFGRIVFTDKALNKEEVLYIGKGGISRDPTHQTVVDWRAPVANAYYENGLGECTYQAPDQKPITITLEQKRTYEIADGRLLDFFDSEVVSNDDLLTKYLAKSKQAVLGEIVATIQKEQNEIIRRSPFHNIIVQGVAGSGKTTVAMHRISYILYNYKERFRPEDFYIVGSNRILLNYITGVLPDLDVYGVKQMTMAQLFVRLLYETWEEKKYHVGSFSPSLSREALAYKGSCQFFYSLKDFCDRLEQSTIPTASIYLDPARFREGFQDGKTGVFDTTGKTPTPLEKQVLLMEGGAIRRYLKENHSVSLQSKILMLNERLIGKIKEAFLGKGISYTDAEKKAILQAYRGYFGKKTWKRSIFSLYQDFLQMQPQEELQKALPTDTFDIYDLAALAYLYQRIPETTVISEAHHIVIDEAQDFGMMAYLCLNSCLRGCTYTIMGDVSQNIHFGSGLTDWEELRRLLLQDPADHFDILKKSYRNTVEISHFATNILNHGQFPTYPVEPIIRHGKEVQVAKLPDRNMLLSQAAKLCKEWQKQGLNTIAVICRDQKEAEEATKELGRHLPLLESDLEKAEFGNGVLVLPVEYTKGLEFDAVLLLDPSKEAYPVDDGHARLLYVAATRALHELSVLHTRNLTGLIADPVPEMTATLQGAPFQDNTAASNSCFPAPGIGAKVAAFQGTNSAASTVPAQEIKAATTKPSPSLSAGTSYSTPAASPLSPASRKRPVAKAAAPAPTKPSDSSLTSLYSGAYRPSIARGQERSSVPGSSTPFSKPGQPLARSASAGAAPAALPPASASQRPADSIKKVPSSPASPMPTSGTQNTASTFSSASQAPSFGKRPAAEVLRLPGHSRIDLAIRWGNKQPDGIYLTSRYGLLRLSPVNSAIVRITFSPSGKILPGPPTGILTDRLEKRFSLRDGGSTLTLSLPELSVKVDKLSGALSFLSGEQKLLLAEQKKLSRLTAPGSQGLARFFTFFDFDKKEQLYGIHPSGDAILKLNASAAYLNEAADQRPPFLVSDKGYGILPVTQAPAIFCDLPAYGSYLYTECQNQADYYFIAGKTQNTLLNAYSYLCGEL